MFTTPHEGGEVLLWDTNPGLIDPDLARQAGRVATDLFRHAKHLPFVWSGKSTNFNHIGIYDPDVSDPPEGTIFGHDRWLELAEPLIEVIGLIQVQRPNKRDSDFASFWGMSPFGRPYSYLGMHTDDKQEEYRSVTQLTGVADVVLVDPTRHDRRQRFTMKPGDEYSVRHSKNSFLATKHKVSVTKNKPRLALFL